MAVEERTRGAPSPDDAWKDAALGSALVVLGLYAAWRINFAERPGFIISTGPLDYASVPTIAALGIAFLAALYTAGTLARMARSRGVRTIAWRRPAAPSLATWRRLGTVAFVAAYVFMLKSLPYFVATAIFLTVMFVLFGQRSPLRVGAVALAGSAVLTALFVYALKLPL